MILHLVSTKFPSLTLRASSQSFIATSSLTSTITTLVALALTSRFGVTRIPGGPSALIFSILYNYSRVVPSVYRYRIMGVTFTDKLNMYIIALAVSLIPASTCFNIEGFHRYP